MAIAALFLLWFARPLIWSASENARLVGAFNTDEQWHLLLLRGAIDQRSLRLGYHPYGYAVLNMGLIPLLVLSRWVPITDQHIIIWLRALSTLFAVASIALTFVMARRYFGRLAGGLSAFLLSFTVLKFLRMSVMSHSDIPQVFFLLLGVYFCCRFAEDQRSEWLLLASAAAGVAFGCKYSGMLLLPVVWLSGVLHVRKLDPSQVRVNSERVVRASRLVTVLAGAGLLVLGSATIPYAAAAYAGAEYFGVSMAGFFNSLRVAAIAAGVGLALLGVAPPIWTHAGQSPKLCSVVELVMLSLFTFAVAFFFTSPFHVFSVRSGFVRGFLYEALHSAFGHSSRMGADTLHWFRVLMSAELLDPLVVGMAGLGMALYVRKVVRWGWSELLSPESLVWVWILGYFGFLLGGVELQAERFLLPIVPFLIMQAADVYSRATKSVAARLSRRWQAAWTIASLLLVIGLLLPGSLNRALIFRRSAVSREQSSDAVLAGQWLAAHYPASTRILYDPYSYVPTTFEDAQATPWGGTLELLRGLQPGVVVVNHSISGLFHDAGQAAAYARGEALFLAKHVYYETLRQGQAGYELARDFGSVQVYVRKDE